MKDVFYTLLVVWIIWRVIDSIYGYKARRTIPPETTSNKRGETTIKYSNSVKNKINATEGEYVEFEEIE